MRGCILIENNLHEFPKISVQALRGISRGEAGGLDLGEVQDGAQGTRSDPLLTSVVLLGGDGRDLIGAVAGALVDALGDVGPGDDRPLAGEVVGAKLGKRRKQAAAGAQ